MVTGRLGERAMNTSENNQPWFEVGEEVLLVSPTRPEFNGEYVVIGVVTDGVDPVTGAPYAKKGLMYSLEGLLHTCNEYGGEGTCAFQSSLRKKHKPAEDDEGEVEGFEGLMGSLTEEVVL